MDVTREELQKHSREEDCWIAIGNKVYDCSFFLKDHPGGKKAILLYAGTDATEEFDMLHDRKVIHKYGIKQGTVQLVGTLK